MTIQILVSAFKWRVLSQKVACLLWTSHFGLEDRENPSRHEKHVQYIDFTATVIWVTSFILIMRTQTLQLNECCLFVIGHVSTISLLLCWPDRPILLYPMSLYHLHDHTKGFCSSNTSELWMKPFHKHPQNLWVSTTYNCWRIVQPGLWSIMWPFLRCSNTNVMYFSISVVTLNANVTFILVTSCQFTFN